MEIAIHTPYSLNKPGKRKNNEDFICPNSETIQSSGQPKIFLVCDGVGGAEKGEVASKIVGETIYNSLNGLKIISESQINDAIINAEKKIDEYLAENEMSEGMATTLTLLAIHDTGITLAHIGDSRIYLFRDNELHFRTKDHSLVQEMVLKNILTEEEARDHPKKNVITKAITGSQHSVMPDIHIVDDVRTDDLFFMCSDGVLESFDDESLKDLLTNGDMSLKERSEFIDLKCSNGSKDNYSSFIIQIQKVAIGRVELN